MNEQPIDVMTFLRDNISSIVHCTRRGLCVKVIYYMNDVCHIKTFKFLEDLIDDVDYSLNLKHLISSFEFESAINLNLKDILISIGLTQLADKSPSIQKQYSGEIFKDGESISDQKIRLKDSALWYRYHYNSNVVMGIDPLIIETETDNDRYFDFVRIYVHCISHVIYDRPTQYQMIQDEGKLIDKMVLDKIKSSKKYRSYGVPINFLKCTSRVLRKDSILEYVFEIKDIK